MKSITGKHYIVSRPGLGSDPPFGSDREAGCDSFYKTKNLVKGIRLPVYKIHTCLNGYMIYWG